MARKNNKRLAESEGDEYEYIDEAIPRLVETLSAPLRDHAEAFLNASSIVGGSQKPSASEQEADAALVEWAKGIRKPVIGDSFFQKNLGDQSPFLFFWHLPEKTAVHEMVLHGSF